MLYNVVLVSAVQQSQSGIHKHISPLFWTCLPFRSPQSMQCSRFSLVIYFIRSKGHGNPLQYSCLENPHGQRSPVGYSPWGHKESDMTERLSTAQHSMAQIPGWLGRHQDRERVMDGTNAERPGDRDSARAEVRFQ